MCAYLAFSATLWLGQSKDVFLFFKHYYLHLNDNVLLLIFKTLLSFWCFSCFWNSEMGIYSALLILNSSWEGVAKRTSSKIAEDMGFYKFECFFMMRQILAAPKTLSSFYFLFYSIFICKFFFLGNFGYLCNVTFPSRSYNF